MFYEFDNIMKLLDSLTQREGYKLHVPVYHSNTTDKWEVSCLMFLSTETKEKVEAAVTFFKESLESLYNLNSVGRMIFYCDKDLTKT